MAAEPSILSKTDRLLGKPVPDTRDKCIANLEELNNFYDNEFKPYYLSGEATAYEQIEIKKRVNLIEKKFSDIRAKLTQLKGSSRKKRATRKLRRKRLPKKRIL